MQDNIVLLDTSAIRLSPASRALLAELPPQGNRIAVTHCPHHYLPSEDQQLLAECLAKQAISTLVSGHIHRDEDNGPYQVTRGIDPDKALGGPPAIIIMDNASGNWQREDIACDFADPRTWPAKERAEWLSFLGISGMKNTLAALTAAAEHNVPSFEIRAAESLALPAATLASAVDAWRRRGGRHLSIHMPTIGLDASGAVKVPDIMPAALEMARQLRAHAVTIHPPAAPVAALRGDSSSTRRCWTPLHRPSLLWSAGIVIGIENMHLRRDEPADEQRFFGYTPRNAEWIAALRKRLGNEAVASFWTLAMRATIAAWPVATTSANGMPNWRWLTGCHLHQFTVLDGKAQVIVRSNPGHAISLSSFFVARQQGQLAHVPMYPEIRTEPAIESYLTRATSCPEPLRRLPASIPRRWCHAAESWR